MGLTAVCFCGTYAIGECVDCAAPVCGKDSSYEGALRCIADSRRAAVASKAAYDGRDKTWVGTDGAPPSSISQLVDDLVAVGSPGSVVVRQQFAPRSLVTRIRYGRRTTMPVSIRGWLLYEEEMVEDYGWMNGRRYGTQFFYIATDGAMWVARDQAGRLDLLPFDLGQLDTNGLPRLLWRDVAGELRNHLATAES